MTDQKKQTGKQSYDAEVLEGATLIRYGRIKPVSDADKCEWVGGRAIPIGTTNTLNSVNIRLIDDSEKGEFMWLLPVDIEDSREVVVHASVDNDSVKKAFGADSIDADCLRVVSDYLAHLVRTRFYYPYEYKGEMP